MDKVKAREWHLFLGTRDSDGAASELMRLVQRLDDAFDIVNYVLLRVSGSPSADSEENLRVARMALNEGSGYFEDLANEFRRHDTDVA